MIKAQNTPNGVQVAVSGTLEDVCIELAAVLEQLLALVRCARYVRTAQHFSAIVHSEDLRKETEETKQMLQAMQKERDRREKSGEDNAPAPWWAMHHEN